ncbi:MAG: class I SAM-dependent methyltransferase [Egibacteraceae bacterium]
MFSGTVEHYCRYRPGIPAEVADILVAVAPEYHPRRLLDIGTGTGLVIEAVLACFDDIIGIDPDADMLAAAEASLRPGVPPSTRLAFQQCAAEELTPPNGWQAHLVTICRTFHWLDQPTVLRRLADQVTPDGAVAIFGDKSFWTTSNPWQTAVRGVVQEFLGSQRRAGNGMFRQHDRPYSEILEDSAFDQVEQIRVPVQREWSIETILGCLYSTSFAAPRLFGERLDEFEQALTQTLAEFSDDVFEEHNEFVIHIGRRSAR